MIALELGRLAERIGRLEEALEALPRAPGPGTGWREPDVPQAAAATPAPVKTAGAAGASDKYAREDHAHALALKAAKPGLDMTSPDADKLGVKWEDTAGYIQGVASAASAGGADKLAHSDHVHKLTVGTGLQWDGGILECGVEPEPPPTGAVLMFAGPSAPEGYLLCDGAAYDAGMYPEYAGLLAAIGHAFGGSGDVFNVPDLRGRFPMGAGYNVSLGHNEGLDDEDRQAIHLHPAGGGHRHTPVDQRAFTASGTYQTGALSGGNWTSESGAHQHTGAEAPHLGLNFIIKT